MLDLFITTISQGLIFGIGALGIYLTFRILDFPDLSVDGTFTLGCSVAAIIILKGYSPFIGIFVAFVAGSLAGMVTGLIHIKGNITEILSGIIVMIGLYSINLRIMGKSNIHLFNSEHIFSNRGAIEILVILTLIAIFLKIIIDVFFKLRIGYVLKAIGENEKFVTALGINPNKIKVIGLMLSNGIVAVSGSLYTQYQGFSDINMGTGFIVSGLAAVVIGEIVFKKMNIIKFTTIAIIGGVAYKFILMIALRLGLAASDLKLITAIMMVIILAKKPSFKIITERKMVKPYVKVKQYI